MSLLNVGSRALLANQAALQTAGHNIANVSTPGYSRQTVVLQTVQGQFTGGGYIGKGVDVQTIQRNHSELLTRQSTAASAVDAGDTVRMDRLRQLQEVFSGGASGIGASINDMMNALSDVVSAPTDLTARSVALTRMDETAARMRDASQRLDEIGYTVAEQLKGSMVAVNSLAKNIAGINEQIARAKGNGQPANDLLDQRDQLIRELNQHIQTSQVAADDGTVSVFVAGSQPLVLGNQAATLSIDDPIDFGAGSGKKVLSFLAPGSSTKVELNENMLGGGQVAGLLRFQNNDLAEGRNLLGRMAIAISESMNTQNRLGLTLNGQPGENLFAPISLGNATPSNFNTSTATMALTVADPTALQASSYTVSFTAGDAGSVTRHSDGKVFNFDGSALPPVTVASVFSAQGLGVTLSGAVNAGDQFVINSLQGAAAELQALQYSPTDLAAANPVNAAMGAANGGSLQLASLKATGPITQPATGSPVTIAFTAGSPATYSATVPGPPVATIATGNYVSGEKIAINGWEIALQGAPKSGDTVTVGNATDSQYGDWYKRDTGNASALMALRDVPMFDNATLADGFASAMAQVGTRTQSAQFAAELSSSIAANLERDRTAVAGVNLDEEAARLIQYQQAYQASAKMIQIAQNIFDTLIQGLGR
ncbi:MULTISPECIES: flagellar hook-associated protein FlgK [unclassified Acidovorax]|jgi:flagellar hook-associated protein 1 FlgK|uniref:flagellar hook-associated protein FlgK n=1 Tax=unclassified Acidovorax TaxID=2684926 RepID=UPI000BCC6948|nr:MULTISPECIES: flagellar hook-associated protein FlgK [unclassified Acidovorax]OYX10988.1 MAG: flagellar hook-associated protein FlgK [Acidovorax sp. 32-64-7]HQS21404.1 flagellar hook-associated protein FlgK [Acidovorax defluvii]OYY26879.1 MAG: flagellar hook-associated protein FlgK [Acidovorax sp. 35-64-16]OYZ70857.1 MAG: flagellar hook-associated protein FlgK [Acidovorax sp. 24-64-9]OZA68786.1 MAG: flagellar hook-associated protein FlgK [Acidovorax sp. 39-64-12]